MSKNNGGCLIRLLRWSNFGLIILTGISYASPHFPSHKFWPFIFLGMGFPVLILLNFILLLFWLYRKKWHALFPLLCLVMCWSEIGKFFGHPFKGSEQSKVQGKEISIMTYNGKSGGKYNTNEPRIFVEEVLAVNPDIICFQEFSPRNEPFKPLRDKYPYRYNRYTQIVLSKYPITHGEDLGLESIRTSNGAMFVDVDVDGVFVRVYNIHLHSNRISGKVDEMKENTDIKDLNDKETYDKTKDILALVKRTSAVRSSQASQVKRHCNTSPYPTLICGDFNDPPQSFTYRILSQGMKDTFVEAGRGFGFTYKGNIPFLKIDYILTTPDIHVQSAQITDTEISDHKMLHSRIVLPLK